MSEVVDPKSGWYGEGRCTIVGGVRRMELSKVGRRTASIDFNMDNCSRRIVHGEHHPWKSCTGGVVRSSMMPVWKKPLMFAGLM